MVVKVQRSLDGKTILVYNRRRSCIYELPYITELDLKPGQKAFWNAHIKGETLVFDARLLPRGW